MLKKYTVYIPAILLFAACSSENPNKEPVMPADSSAMMMDSAVNTISGKVDMVISDIPFPFEVLEDLHSSGVAYDQKVINAVGNIAKYNQYNAKALNLGVYGADLAYVVTYEQFQQIGAYVKNAKKLAEDLNIPFAFNQEMMDKYSRFKENKDSLTRVVFDSYNQVDKTLKGDERVGIAALVVAGSWVEGLYLSTKTFGDAVKTDQNKKMYETIGAQRQSLKLVIKLLSEYKNDPYIAKLIEDLKEIAPVQGDNTTGSSVSADQLITTAKVAALRNKIIEGL